MTLFPFLLRGAKMSDEAEDAEDVFYGCVECKGANNRGRRSEGSALCKFDGCKRAYSKKRKAGALSFVEAHAATSARAPTVCYKIKQVVGVSLCLPGDMSGYEKRVGKKMDDNCIAYQVCGGFGEDRRDEFIPDTRWVKLSELLESGMSEQALKVLDTFAGKLQAQCKEARKRLRLVQEAEDECMQ